MIFRFIVILLTCCFAAPSIWNRHSCNFDDVRSWIMLSIAALFIGIVLQALALSYYFRRNHFLVSLDLLSSLVRLFFVGWAIYGNVIYYESDRSCFSISLKIGLFFLYVYGYFEILKAALVVLTFICCIPLGILIGCCLGDNRIRWQSAPATLIAQLSAMKYDSALFKNEACCGICYGEFEKDEDVTPLPCDSRHFFHTTCIKEWFRTKNSCPYCNKEVTLDAIATQRDT